MSILQLEGHIIDIPIREQDDPPDEMDLEPASLEIDSDTEHGSFGSDS